MAKIGKALVLLAGLLLGAPSAQAQSKNDAPVVWLQGEYLLWATSKAPLSATLVTSSTSPNPATSTGVIGQPGTVALAGGSLGERAFSGFRVSGGLGPDWFLPVELSYFRLERAAVHFNTHSDATGSPVLARPVFATQPDVNGEVVFLSSFPTLGVGGVNITSSSRMWGADAHLVGHVYECEGVRLDVMAGFRYLELDEELRITSTATPLNPQFGIFFNGQTFGVGDSTSVTDQFLTQNRFSGGQVAARLLLNFSGAFTGASLELVGKLGIGVTDEVTTINGSSTLTRASGETATLPGGILAVPSNSGRSSHERFALIPEATVNAGYDLTRWLRFTVGYNFLYWGKVVRPGALIDRSVDTRQVVTDVAFNPAVQVPHAPFVANEKSFWAQGLNVGLAISY
jgi:hypothetical protein